MGVITVMSRFGMMSVPHANVRLVSECKREGRFNDSFIASKDN